MSITDQQSFSIVLRDAFLAKLAGLPFFQGFTIGKSKMLQRQPENIPYLGLYIIEEVMTPDGDLNHGDIDFIHSLRLGFSVLIANNDPVAAELKCDEAYWAIMNGLWRDAYLTNFLNTYDPHIGAGTPDNVRLEGVERATRKFVWGNANSTNELPVGELQYEAAIRYRANYPPIITDDLLRVHVETVPLDGDGTVPPADQVQRIISEYEFTPQQEASHDGDPGRPECAATANRGTEEAPCRGDPAQAARARQSGER